MIPIREYIESAKALSDKHLGEHFFVVWRRKSRPKIIRGQEKHCSYLRFNWFTVAECFDGEILYVNERYA
jgi:hypothetical protein